MAEADSRLPGATFSPAELRRFIYWKAARKLHVCFEGQGRDILAAVADLTHQCAGELLARTNFRWRLAGRLGDPRTTVVQQTLGNLFWAMDTAGAGRVNIEWLIPTFRLLTKPHEPPNLLIANTATLFASRVEIKVPTSTTGVSRLGPDGLPLPPPDAMLVPAADLLRALLLPAETEADFLKLRRLMAPTLVNLALPPDTPPLPGQYVRLADVRPAVDANKPFLSEYHAACLRLLPSAARLKVLRADALRQVVRVTKQEAAVKEAKADFFAQRVHGPRGALAAVRHWRHLTRSRNTGRAMHASAAAVMLELKRRQAVHLWRFVSRSARSSTKFVELSVSSV